MEERKFDDRLLKILEEEVLKEKWKKKAKIIGYVVRKKISKKGSIVLIVNTKNSEYDVIVPQYKQDLFDIAKGINEGELISVVGDKQLSGMVFADIVEKVNNREMQKKL